MKMLNVIVQNVTINVKNVLLMKNVMFVPLTELKMINHLAHVQKVLMKTKLQFAHNVLTNVVLVLTILLVLNVVKIDLTFQLVSVLKDFMKNLKSVKNVLINVELVKKIWINVLFVLKEELMLQIVTVQKENMTMVKITPNVINVLHNVLPVLEKLIIVSNVLVTELLQTNVHVHLNI